MNPFSVLSEFNSIFLSLKRGYTHSYYNMATPTIEEYDLAQKTWHQLLEDVFNNEYTSLQIYQSFLNIFKIKKILHH